jgi:hypothetical protein
MTDKRTYTITVESPHGSSALDNFEHWINKVSDEAKSRWGIEISMEEVAPDTPDEGFSKANE